MCNFSELYRAHAYRAEEEIVQLSYDTVLFGESCYLGVLADCMYDLSTVTPYLIMEAVDVIGKAKAMLKKIYEILVKVISSIAGVLKRFISSVKSKFSKNKGLGNVTTFVKSTTQKTESEESNKDKDTNANNSGNTVSVVDFIDTESSKNVVYFLPLKASSGYKIPDTGVKNDVKKVLDSMFNNTDKISIQQCVEIIFNNKRHLIYDMLKGSLSVNKADDIKVISILAAHKDTTDELYDYLNKNFFEKILNFDLLVTAMGRIIDHASGVNNNRADSEKIAILEYVSKELQNNGMLDKILQNSKDKIPHKGKYGDDLYVSGVNFDELKVADLATVKLNLTDKYCQKLFECVCLGRDEVNLEGDVFGALHESMVKSEKMANELKDNAEKIMDILSEINFKNDATSAKKKKDALETLLGLSKSILIIPRNILVITSTILNDLTSRFGMVIANIYFEVRNIVEDYLVNDRGYHKNVAHDRMNKAMKEA